MATNACNESKLCLALPPLLLLTQDPYAAVPNAIINPKAAVQASSAMPTCAATQRDRGFLAAQTVQPVGGGATVPPMKQNYPLPYDVNRNSLSPPETRLEIQLQKIRIEKHGKYELKDTPQTGHSKGMYLPNASRRLKKFARRVVLNALGLP